MLFKSTSAFKKQSVKPKKSGLENPLDSFLGRNSILDDKYEDTVSQKFFLLTFSMKGQIFIFAIHLQNICRKIWFSNSVLDILIIWVLKFACH